MTRTVTVNEMIKAVPLEVLSGHDYLNREIKTSDLSRPALELTGYFSYYPYDRIQLFGRTEISFMEKMTDDERMIVMRRICHKETPALLISRGLQPPKEFIQAAAEAQIPILKSENPTTRLTSNVTNYLEGRLATRLSVHGVLVDIYGMGVLITGDSGIGKSETALELIQRGHRLVADDRVDLYMLDEHRIVGEPPEVLAHLIEIRGVGIIDVINLFGVGSIRTSKTVNLVVDLKMWDKEVQFDRLGSAAESNRYFNVDIPKISIPVRTGRNLAIIIEVAAKNFRAKQMGYDAIETLNKNLEQLIKKNSVAENEDE